MMLALLAVASIAARRIVTEIKVHLQRQDQVFHRSDHNAYLSAPDKGIASKMPIHNGLKGGNVLANEKEAQVVLS